MHVVAARSTWSTLFCLQLCSQLCQQKQLYAYTNNTVISNMTEKIAQDELNGAAAKDDLTLKKDEPPLTTRRT